jgi:hypothetical protein
MATWTKRYYGAEDRQWFEEWVPATGSNRACLIYFHGSGFSAGWTDLLYSATNGEAFFLDQIATREATAGKEVVCVSVMVAQDKYDFETPIGSAPFVEAWADTTAYTFGDYVGQGGSHYFCIRDHTSAAANDQPGSGTNWTDYWRESFDNDLNNKLRPATGAMTSGYLGTGMQDAMLAYNYVVEHATQYGINPAKIVVMGQSAGGQKMSPIIWNLQGARMPYVEPAAANPHRLRTTQRPVGAIFRQTWDTLANYPQPASVSTWIPRLVGRPFTDAEWTAYPDDLKNALSNQGILELTRDVIPCYFEYVTAGEQHDDGVDNTPPYTTSAPHHPKNGWQLLTRVVDTYGGTGNIFVEDAEPGDSGYVDTSSTRKYSDSTSSFTIFDRSGSGQANGLTADMWTWFEGVTGI